MATRLRITRYSTNVSRQIALANALARNDGRVIIEPGTWTMGAANTNYIGGPFSIEGHPDVPREQVVLKVPYANNFDVATGFAGCAFELGDQTRFEHVFLDTRPAVDTQSAMVGFANGNVNSGRPRTAYLHDVAGINNVWGPYLWVGPDENRLYITGGCKFTAGREALSLERSNSSISQYVTAEDSEFVVDPSLTKYEGAVNNAVTGGILVCSIRGGMLRATRCLFAATAEDGHRCECVTDDYDTGSRGDSWIELDNCDSQITVPAGVTPKTLLDLNLRYNTAYLRNMQGRFPRRSVAPAAKVVELPI